MMDAMPNKPDLSRQYIVIVCSKFNEYVVKALHEGARKALREYGIREEQIQTVWVPGAFELPLVAKTAALRSDVAAVVCLGAVIRGETPHFKYVSQSAALGILQAGLESGKPVTFGVLTTDTPEQAFERAGGKVGNKGKDAASAALDMLNALSIIGGLPSA